MPRHEISVGVEYLRPGEGVTDAERIANWGPSVHAALRGTGNLAALRAGLFLTWTPARGYQGSAGPLPPGETPLSGRRRMTLIGGELTFGHVFRFQGAPTGELYGSLVGGALRIGSAGFEPVGGAGAGVQVYMPPLLALKAYARVLQRGNPFLQLGAGVALRW
jgi:hypothetical protein